MVEKRDKKPRIEAEAYKRVKILCSKKDLTVKEFYTRLSKLLVDEDYSWKENVPDSIISVVEEGDSAFHDLE